MWPGNYTSRVGDGSKTSWPLSEIVRQIDITRHQQGAGGNLHFSMKSLMEPKTGLARALSTGSYAEPALIPASPWLVHEKLSKPKVALDRDSATGQVEITWKPGNGKTWLWLVQAKRSASWRTLIVPGAQISQSLADLLSGQRDAVVAVTPVDRCGNLGPSSVVEIEDPGATVAAKTPAPASAAKPADLTPPVPTTRFGLGAGSKNK